MTNVPVAPKPRSRRSLVLLIVGIVGLVAATIFVVYSALASSQPSAAVPLAPLPVTVLDAKNAKIGSGFIQICATNPLNLGERGQITFAILQDVNDPPPCAAPLVSPPNVLFTQTGGAMSVFENPQVEVTVQPSGTFSINPSGKQPIVGKGTWVVIPNSVSDLDVNNFSIQVPVKAALPRRPLVDLTLSLSFTVEIKRNLIQLVQQYVATAQGLLVSIGGLAGAVLAIVGLVERIRRKPAPKP